VKKMSEEEKDKELDYVFSTIGSSWEFVNYIFLITDVTRAFTHQLVRHRAGTSFAQQAQRMADVRDFSYLASGECAENSIYHFAMQEIRKAYGELIDNGVNIQDARGILPTNIHTNILFGVNLRALSNISEVRLCLRAQGEFQDVVRKMKEEVVKVHPWAERVLKCHCVKYGVCLFPRFNCAIKEEHPELQPSAEKLRAIEKTWQKFCGTSLQPDGKIIRQEDSSDV